MRGALSNVEPGLDEEIVEKLRRPRVEVMIRIRARVLLHTPVVERKPQHQLPPRLRIR
jgi:hypothetical protein